MNVDVAKMRLAMDKLEKFVAESKEKVPATLLARWNKTADEHVKTIGDGTDPGGKHKDVLLSLLLSALACDKVTGICDHIQICPTCQGMVAKVLLT